MLADEISLTAQMAQRQRPRGNSTETLFGPDVSNSSLLEMAWCIGALGHGAPYVPRYGLIASARRSVRPLTCAFRIAARK